MDGSIKGVVDSSNSTVSRSLFSELEYFKRVWSLQRNCYRYNNSRQKDESNVSLTR